MPELPEVENVCRGLSEILPAGLTLESIEFRRKDLRFKLPIKQLIGYCGARLILVRRRAKFIFFEFDRGIVFSHLGMTGQWRKHELAAPFLVHDHLVLKFSGDLQIVYRDPRRFGFLDCISRGAAPHKLLKNLGIEPLSEEFSGEFLAKFFKNKKASVKSALLDQRGVAGLGNIYVCEALFRSGIRPQKMAKKVRPDKLSGLASEIKKILKASIESGGSSIRDYRNSRGQAGSFQDQHLVYGREGQLCLICHSLIKNIRLSGRSSFWCPTCQL